MFDTERMKYPYTGLYYFSLGLGRALAKCKPDKQHTLSYYGPREALSLFDVPQMHNLCQSPLHKFYLPVPRRIDVWHCAYQTSAYLPSRKSIKVVMTIHDVNFMYDPTKSKKKQQFYLDRVAQHIKRADHIVTISKFVQDDLRKFGVLPVNKPSSVIYNGYRIGNDKQALTSPKFNPKRPFLFSVAVVARKKNFHVLPAVLQHLDCDLVIAGKWEDSVYLSEIQAEIEAFNLQDRVHLLGSISENDKNWYLQNCQAFVFLSLSEGFGIPVIEAMSFGKPVILSRLTALPEVGGEAAYYVNDFTPFHIAQTVLHAINDVKLRKLSDGIKAYARRFDWNIAAKAYWKVYENLF